MNIRWERQTARVAGVALAIALLGGCATGPRIVRTEVTSFDQWATLPADRRYVFARTLEYQDSLEMKSYEDIVRDELVVQGLTVANDASQASLVVTLRPSTSSTRIRTRDPWPYGYGGYYGHWGYGGLGGYGPFYGGPFYGGPFYGGAYFNDFGTSDVDVYRHRIELDIDSKSVVGKRYYEGRVESSDDSSANAPVMPALIRALFSDFPGNNGQTRRVDVPVERH